MADLAQIAQSGVDPVSGSYLSAERRKAIFAKSRNVSSNIFRRGGALVPTNNQPDSGALALVQTQSQTITSLQEQINSLRVRDEGSLALVQNQSKTITSLQEQVNGLRTQVGSFDNVIKIQTQTIGGVQEQIGGVGANIKQLSSSINGITNAINTDSILEQRRTKQEQDEQTRATEQGLRAGRESILERVLQAALIAPVQKIAEKAQSILSRVAQFFTTLFLGWFANQGIEVLKGLSEGNTQKLEEIRDNVLKGLAVAAVTLSLLSGGFIAIVGTITNLSLKISGWLLKNTVGKFFGALGNLLKSAGAGVSGAVKAGAAALTGGGAAAAASGSADDAVKAAAKGGGAAAKAASGSADDAAKVAAKGGGKLLGRVLPAAQTALGVGFGINDLSQGKPISAAFNFLSAVPGPIGWGGLGLGLGYDLLGSPGEGKANENKKEPSKAAPMAKMAPTPEKSKEPAAKTTPTTTKNPAKPAPAKPAESKEPQNFLQPPEYGRINIAPTAEESASNAKPEPMAMAPAVQPQTPIIPPPSPEMAKNFQMAWDNRDKWYARGRIESAWNKLSPEEQQQAKAWAKSTGKDWTEMKLVEKPIVSQTKQVQQVQAPSQPAKIDTLSKSNSMSMIGPAPEPKPSVIYQKMGPSSQQRSGSAPTGSSANQVPAISASNPDNFYVLYSQVNYNVVM
jgi:archaellum component FlaC